MIYDLSDDEVLLDLLAQALADAADPVPSAAVASAKAAARLSDLDAELATLLADSALDSEVLLFRHDLTLEQAGEVLDRMLSFSTPQLEVDVELAADGSTVVGAITPPAVVTVEVETTSGVYSTTSDELGRFRLRSGTGPCRIRIQTPAGTVVTPWITR